MALTGELTDLSLAELIEFFCNQRKTGRLKVIYSDGPGYFYLQAGSVVHAKLGALRGIEAVYYALTLPNASFKFSAAFEPPERTINQPWTSVVLEGLRRMDEGVEPGNPFPEDYVVAPEDTAPLVADYVASLVEDPIAPLVPDHAAPVLEDRTTSIVADHAAKPVEAHAVEDKKPALELAAAPANDVTDDFSSDTHEDVEFTPWLSGSEPAWLKKPWALWAVGAAVVLILAAVGIPWGWYAHSQSAKAISQPKTSVEVASQASTSSTEVKVPQDSPAATVPNAPSASSEAAPASSDTDTLAAKRQREARAKEKVKAQETASANPVSAPSSAALPPVKPPVVSSASRKVTVQVSYDENGRVTQASGADATALRIARQKRFPPGKAGSATITIPIN